MKYAVALVALLGVLSVATPAQAAPQGVAVVNMVELLNNHPQIKEIERKLEQRQQAAQQYAEAEEKRLRQLKGSIDLMNPNDPARMQKMKQFLAQSNMLKFEIEWRKEQAMKEYMDGLEGLYNDISRLVSSYARDNNLQLVLLKPPQELESADLNDYFVKVQLRSVIFSTPQLDITDRIKAMFTPRPPAPPAAPPPAVDQR